jgi:hypothetical protein
MAIYDNQSEGQDDVSTHPFIDVSTAAIVLLMGFRETAYLVYRMCKQVGYRCVALQASIIIIIVNMLMLALMTVLHI